MKKYLFLILLGLSAIAYGQNKPVKIVFDRFPSAFPIAEIIDQQAAADREQGIEDLQLGQRRLIPVRIEPQHADRGRQIGLVRQRSGDIALDEPHPRDIDSRGLEIVPDIV